MTFSNGDHDVLEQPEFETIYSEEELLFHALSNPGFFGHHVLAFVWGRRLKPRLPQEEWLHIDRTQMVLNGEYESEDASHRVQALHTRWSEDEFDRHLIQFFREGPQNIHQITLAEALLWCWVHYPKYRNLIAANLLCFTKGTRP